MVIDTVKDFKRIVDWKRKCMIMRQIDRTEKVNKKVNDTQKRHGTLEVDNANNTEDMQDEMSQKVKMKQVGEERRRK